MPSNVTRDHHTWTRDTVKNVSGDVTLDLAGDLTIDVAGGQCTITDNTAGDPDLVIKANDDTTSAGNLTFIKDRGGDGGTVGQDGDSLGFINWFGYNDTNELWYFAQIKANIVDATNNDEAGSLSISVQTRDAGFAGSAMEVGLKLEGTATNDEVDVTIANGTASITTIAGDVRLDGDTISTAGNVTLDSEGDISLDAAGGEVYLKDGGASFGALSTAASASSLVLYENGGASTDDSLTISVAANGQTAIATNDDAGDDADLLIKADGDLSFNSSTGVFKAIVGLTEFSATDSAYAGMILGYTRLEYDRTSQLSFEIQNTLTVESSTHQITFKTPPSERVEIQATFCIDVRSTDTRIAVGLSDNASYNGVAEYLEYDSIGISFSDDEIDDGVRTVQFVLDSAHLEAVGVTNTFYIGFSTAGATKTAYLIYGVRASHSVADHPFIIKATALPATIYTG